MELKYGAKGRTRYRLTLLIVLNGIEIRKGSRTLEAAGELLIVLNGIEIRQSYKLVLLRKRF